jgi:hypothetical protein
MKSDNNQYIAEVDLKSIGKGLGTGLLAGSALFGGMQVIGKVAGIGRYAQQETETSTPIKPINVETQNNQNANTQKSEIKPQVQQTSQQKPNFEFETEHVKKLYGALVSAEHRGNVKDPHSYNPKHYIRNKVTTASTAYGPAQITVSTAKGYADMNNPYHKAYIEQGKKFIQSSKDNKTYGLGGKGELSGQEYDNGYKHLASAVMKGKAKELGIDITKQLSKEDLNKFIQHWRHGISSKNRPEKWYSSTIHNYYYGQ